MLGMQGSGKGGLTIYGNARMVATVPARSPNGYWGPQLLEADLQQLATEYKVRTRSHGGRQEGDKIWNTIMTGKRR